MAKKFLSILLTLVLVLGLLPAAGAAAVSTSPTFSDMPDNWATEALESAVANGLLVGDDGKIMPDSPLTRAQMATIIARAFGATKEGDISEYADVKSTDWFAGSMAKAYKMGVMQGYAGKMEPNSNISREQAFAVLARTLKLEPASVINKTYEDEWEISDWAKAEVYALVNAGYIQGSNGKLNPQANISRAEFAQMMHNLIKQYIKAEGEYTQVADGNIMVNVPNVTLKNVTITGDLIVGDGVGDGDLILDNVTIKGRLLARGGGVNSIIIIGGSVEGKVIVAKVDGDIRVSVEGGADVEVIVIDDGKDDVIIEGTVGTVEVSVPDVPVIIQNATISKIDVNCEGAADITIAETGSVTNVVIGGNSEGTALNVEGNVTNIETSAPDTVISGTGAVGTVTANEGADNTSVTTPNTVVNNEGASAVTAGGGKEVPEDSSATNNNQGTDVITTPPSGGSGGGPSYVAVSVISVDVEAITLGVGETVTITATVEPSNATRKTVTWTSSDVTIASVANGVVTAVAEGEAIITATAGGKTAEAVITVLPVAIGEEAADLLEWFVGWPTLSFHSEERGNSVGYDFKLKEGKISDLSDVTVSIFKEGIKIATNTLKDPSIYNGTELTGSFYTNDIKETGSWYVEQISGALGEDIFDKLEMRVVYGGKVYTVDQAELRPIEGNVKNLTKKIGYSGIQDAITNAADNNVIVVAQGEYVEDLEITKPITLKSIVNGESTIKGNITIQADNVTIDGFKVEATDTTAPVIHMIDSDNVNIINNTVIAQGYASIGTSTGPARVTGKISGNTVTGMIIVGTDGELEVSNNHVTVTETSSEGICFWPVGEEAELTVEDNIVGEVGENYAQIKVDQKPKSVNGETNEVDILSAISEDNNGATAKLTWIKTVGDYDDIEVAINAATTGDNIIAVYPGDYGDEPIKIVQKEGVNITLAAVGEVVLKNQIKIDGDARSEGQDYVSIKGFTFDFSDATGGIITTAKIDSPNYVYAHNIFIEDCVFIGNSDNVVAVRADAQGGHYNFLIKGCTGTNLHSLAQLTSVDGVTVKDCSVSVGEGGINLQNSTDITITNFTVEASMDVNSYGVRAGQSTDSPVNESNTMTISNSNFEAKHPIWLRGDAPGTVIITDSTLTASEDGEMIYNDANGTVNITIDEAAYVTSEEELKTALANTSVKGIILGDDIELTEYVNLNNNKGLVLDGNGQTITTVYDGRNPCGLYLASDNITIKNVTITGESKVGIDTKRGTKGLSIIDVTFKGMGIGFYANPDVKGTIEKCIFEYLGTGIGINGSSFSTVDNSFSNIRNMYLEIFGERTEEEINEILGDNTFDSEVEAVFEESKWTIIS